MGHLASFNSAEWYVYFSFDFRSFWKQYYDDIIKQGTSAKKLRN
jgi:hypothetical protein